MDNKHKIKTTTRDRLMRAWEDSMELVRDFELSSHEIADNPEVAHFFSESALSQGLQASKFRELLEKYEGGQGLED